MKRSNSLDKAFISSLENKGSEQKDNSPEPFGVLLIGGFSGNESPSSIDIFLDSAAISLTRKSCSHLIRRDGSVFFHLVILRDVHRLLHRLLVPHSHLVFVLADSIEDFDTCANIIKGMKSTFPKDSKIYYLNKFPEGSREYSIIKRDAEILKYECVNRYDEIAPLLEKAREAYWERVASLDNETSQKEDSIDDKAPRCRLL